VKSNKNKLTFNYKTTILKISIFGIIIDRILFYIISMWTSFFEYSLLEFLGDFISSMIFSLNLIFTILIISISIVILDYIRIKKSFKKPIKMLEISIFFIGLIICTFQILFEFEIISQEIQILLLSIIGNFFIWILKILLFFGFWIFILGYVMIKKYKYIGNLKYKVINSKVFGTALIFSDAHGNNKGISILEVTNIPNNIRVRENRIMMKNIEKMFTDSNQQYLHYHLSILFSHLEQANFSYEISLHHNKIHFRLIISVKNRDLDELLKNLKSKVEIIEEIYKTSFPGLKFAILYGENLRKTWTEIIGGIGKYKIKKVKDDIIEINQYERKLFLQIIKLIGKPKIKAYSEKTQIDSLIMALLSSNVFDGSFIVNIKPVETYMFENQRKNSNFNLNTNSIKNIRQNLLKIRHSEMTCLWKVSAYFVVRSYNGEEVQRTSKKIMAILDSVFSGDQYSIKSELIGNSKLQYVLPSLLTRDNLFDKSILTSESLATYLHLPEEPFPSINRTSIPNFEIPPEDIVDQKLIIGKVLFQDKTDLFPVGLDIMDLRLNMFVTGLIGMGKTTFVMNILKNLTKFYPDINWICLDWKGDYVNLIKSCENTPVLVLRPGSNEAPFQINMFNPYNSNGEEHARKLFSIIVELFKSDFQNKSELSIQMERVCRDVIREVVCNPSKRSLKSFFEELKSYERENMSSNQTLKMTINSLINRFDRFRTGNLNKIFNVENTPFDFQILMDKKVIFDFNYLLSNGGTKQDVRFLMNLILKLIFDNALQRGLTQELKHIVVIEDSQLLLPAILREVAETNLGEDIPLLLRGVGQGMITIATRPEISPDVISNSGIKISFRSTYDSKKIANYQNLNKEQEEYLKIMPKQEAIITIPSFSYPFRIKSININFPSVSNKDIYENNKHFFPFVYDNISTDNIEQSINNNNLNSVNNNSQKLKPISKNKIDYELNFEELSNITSNVPQDRLENTASNDFKLPKNLKLETWEKSYWKKISNNGKNFYLKLRKILQLQPYNKFQILKELNISNQDFQSKIKELIDIDIIKEKLVPVFEKDVLQKWYYLNNDEDYFLNLIKEKIEIDFVQPGFFVYFGNESQFDYIWHSENAAIKLYLKDYNTIEKNEFSKEFTEWMMESCEKNINHVIIITSFISDREKIKHWLKEWNYQEVEVFCYYKDDWKLLKSLIKEGISDERKVDDFLDNIYNNLGHSPHLPENTENHNDKIQNNTLPSKKKLMKNFDNIDYIKEIKRDFTDYYPDPLLERFGSDFPTAKEIAKYLGCNIHSVDSETKPIRKYLKKCKIHDLEDTNIFDIYYGWSNTISGKLVLKNKIIEQLSDINITFKDYSQLSNNTAEFDIYLPDHSIIINFIYEEGNINNLRETIKNQLIAFPNIHIVIICYNIEIKEKLKRKLKNWNFKNGITLLRYDWIEIRPWIRKLLKSH